MTETKSEPSIVSETLGWIGTAAILGSYTLLSLNLLDNNSVLYHVVVLLGSILLTYITYLQKSFQPFAINIVFAVLSLIALLRITI